jgi:hypothetical protein
MAQRHPTSVNTSLGHFSLLLFHFCSNTLVSLLKCIWKKTQLATELQKKSFPKRKVQKQFSGNQKRLVLVVVPYRNAATVNKDVNAAKHLQSCFALSFQGLQLRQKRLQYNIHWQKLNHSILIIIQAVRNKQACVRKIFLLATNRSSHLQGRVRGSSAGKPVCLYADWSADQTAHAACLSTWPPV